MSLLFLRPYWLLLVPLILLLAWLLWRQRLRGGEWSSVVDASLLPHLLVGRGAPRRRGWFVFWLTLALLAVVALAGPVWKKLPEPVFRQQSALVIALDLSQSMNAADIRPSRLDRARLKLIDILNAREEGQTALLAYAATAFTITPLTDDSATIRALVSSLSTDLMPAQGSRPDRALEQAQQLLVNAGVEHGHILFITDGINAAQVDAIQDRHNENYPVSFLGVGTQQGAPIAGPNGGFVKDRDGAIVVAKTDPAVMRDLAQRMDGRYVRISLDDRDIERLQDWLAQSRLSRQHQLTEFNTDRWREEGPWLLLLITPLAALAFRRGLIIFVLALLLVPPLQPVQAAEPSLWQRLWYNSDQLAHQALMQDDPEQAAKLFEDSEWKAAAQYRAGKYEDALRQYQDAQSAEERYNRANALAKLGRLQEALEAYDEVLERSPENEDAAYNRDLVKQALHRQQQNQAQGPQDQNSQDQNNAQDQQDAQNTRNGQNSEQEPQAGQQAQQQDQGGQSGQGQNDQDQANQNMGEPQPNSTAQQRTPRAMDENLKGQSPESAAQQDSSDDDKQRQANTDPQQSDSTDSPENLDRQAEAQWLRRIPDDPGGLLRNKFRYQYGRQPQPEREQEPW